MREEIENELNALSQEEIIIWIVRLKDTISKLECDLDIRKSQLNIIEKEKLNFERRIAEYETKINLLTKMIICVIEEY